MIIGNCALSFLSLTTLITSSLTKHPYNFICVSNNWFEYVALKKHRTYPVPETPHSSFRRCRKVNVQVSEQSALYLQPL